jgi:hypothetical protein
MMLAPGITLIMAILFLGEMPSPIAWVGIGMVLSAGFVGMFVLALARRQMKGWLEPLRRGGLKWRFVAADAFTRHFHFSLATRACFFLMNKTVG